LYHVEGEGAKPGHFLLIVNFHKVGVDKPSRLSRILDSLGKLMVEALPQSPVLRLQGFALIKSGIRRTLTKFQTLSFVLGEHKRGRQKLVGPVTHVEIFGHNPWKRSTCQIELQYFDLYQQQALRANNSLVTTIAVSHHPPYNRLP
jgi:hypothetical protein